MPRVMQRSQESKSAQWSQVWVSPGSAQLLAWADNLVGRMGGWSGFALRVLLPIALLVGSGAALYGWQQNRLAAEVEEIDAQLLTDDLPIDAYLDRGFQNWLKKRAADE